MASPVVFWAVLAGVVAMIAMWSFAQLPTSGLDAAVRHRAQGAGGDTASMGAGRAEPSAFLRKGLFASDAAPKARRTEVDAEMRTKRPAATRRAAATAADVADERVKAAKAKAAREQRIPMRGSRHSSGRGPEGARRHNA